MSLAESNLCSQDYWEQDSSKVFWGSSSSTLWLQCHFFLRHNNDVGWHNFLFIDILSTGISSTDDWPIHQSVVFKSHVKKLGTCTWFLIQNLLGPKQLGASYKWSIKNTFLILPFYNVKQISSSFMHHPFLNYPGMTGAIPRRNTVDDKAAP